MLRAAYPARMRVRGVPRTIASSAAPGCCFPANACRVDAGRQQYVCLLYTSDAADDTPCVDL
eukprot:9209935-Pyramimonas_sp.AAC.1